MKFINLKNTRQKIDFVLVKIIIITYSLITLFAIVRRINFSSSDDLFVLLFYSTFVEWIAVIIFMIFVSIAAKQMFINKVKIIYVFFVHLILALTLGVFTTFLSTVISHFLEILNLAEANNFVDFTGILRALDRNITNYLAITAIIYTYFYIKRLKEIEIQKVQLENLFVTAKIKTLKAQLQPHFLFNSMQTISNLIHLDSNLADKAIANLSDILRFSINQLNNDFVDIKQELSFTEKYLDFQKLRYQDQISYELRIDQNLMMENIPPLILQPLVENSIKHGFEVTGSAINIEISVFEREKKLVLCVKDNGLGFEENNINKTTSTGLNNLKDRLKYFYGDDYEFCIKNITQGTQVDIMIPKVKKNE